MKIIDLTKNYLNSLVQEIIGKIPHVPVLAKNVTIHRMLILVITALILSLLLTPQIEFNHPYFEIGSIAPKDIKADRDFLVEDKSSTEQKKQELAGHAKSVYDYDSSLAMNLISDVYANFSSVSEVYQQNKENKTSADLGKKALNVAISEFEKSLGFKLSHEELTFLSRNDFSQDIAEKIVRLIDSLYKNIIVVNSNLTANELSDGIIIRDLKTQSEYEKKDFSTILSLDKITNYLDNEELSILQGVSEDVRRNAISLATKLIKPNLTFNKNATEKKKQEILAGVKPVFFLVQKNEMIVREGQKILEIDKEKLESFYRKKGQASFSNLSTVFGIFLSVVFLGLVLYYWRTRNWPKKHDRSNIDSLFLSTAAVFQILLVKAGIFLADAINRAFPYLSVEACFYAIPFATAAMLVAVLTNRNMALVLSIFISFIISFLFENNVKMSLFCFLGSVASSYHVVSCRQRSAFFKAGLFLGLFNSAVIFCLGLISKEIFSMELLIRLAMGMAGGLVSGILVAGMTPLFETILNIQQI